MAVGRWSEFKTYGAECAQLLYQIYFQPYTLNQRLRELHPELDITTNAFQFRGEFAEHPGLERYAQQSWWLTALAPVVAILIVAPVYSLGAEEPFDFRSSGLFLLGWWNEFWTENEEQQSLLLRLAQQQPLIVSDRPALAQLQEKSILDRLEGNNYQFQIPLIQKFVATKIL
ncbi:MAG: hypothetical protein HC916_09455 [Coleofasciculaceae cyanobacterium SM2_1_6]|nr:hypothetical protein [Coleofasciculaceae cyanobacterium SM2_1_6]